MPKRKHFWKMSREMALSNETLDPLFTIDTTFLIIGKPRYWLKFQLLNEGLQRQGHGLEFPESGTWTAFQMRPILLKNVTFNRNYTTTAYAGGVRKYNSSWPSFNRPDRNTIIFTKILSPELQFSNNLSHLIYHSRTKTKTN